MRGLIHSAQAMRNKCFLQWHSSADLRTGANRHRRLSPLLLLASLSVLVAGMRVEASEPLEDLADSLLNWKLEWRMEQTLAADPDTLARSIKELEAQAESGVLDKSSGEKLTPRQRLDLANTIKQLKEEGIPTDEVTSIINLSLIARDRFYAQQQFIRGDSKIPVEYYANADGLVYTVQPDRQFVDVTDQPEGTLGSIFRGFPPLDLLEVIDSKAFNKQSEDEHTITFSSGSVGERQTVIEIAKPLFSVSRILVKRGDELLSETVAEEGYLPGTSLPESVTYIEYVSRTKAERFKQTWKLISAAPIADPSSVNTQCVLPPKYRVRYNTATRHEEVQSDELIGTDIGQ